MPLLKSLSAWPKARRNTFNSIQFNELIWFIFSTVGARLSYPECKDISASSNATEAKYIYTGYLNPRSVQYFRLGPEHFYSSNDLYLRVSWNLPLPFTCWRWLIFMFFFKQQFKTMYGLARYCVSTTKELPGTGDTCKTALQAGDTVEFKFTQPCGKMVPNQCSNIYISAAATTIEDNMPCSGASS